MQCVSPGSNPAWQQCYHLLLQALQGYSICLDPRDIPKGTEGGRDIQEREREGEKGKERGGHSICLDPHDIPKGMEGGKDI